MSHLTAKQCLPVSQALKNWQELNTAARLNVCAGKSNHISALKYSFLGRWPTGRGIAAFLDEHSAKSKTRKLRRRSCELIGASVHKEQTVTLGTAECDGGGKKKLNRGNESSLWRWWEAGKHLGGSSQSSRSPAEVPGTAGGDGNTMWLESWVQGSICGSALTQQRGKRLNWVTDTFARRGRRWMTFSYISFSSKRRR